MPIVLAVLFLATDDESVISRQFQNNNNENIMSVRLSVYPWIFYVAVSIWLRVGVCIIAFICL